MNLTLRIFLALLAGLVVGALLPADIGKPLLPVTDAIGNLWLQALQMTIIPLIAGLLFTGIAQSVGQAGGGKVAGRALLAFLALLIFSALWSMIFVPLLLDWWPAPPAAAAAIVANSAGAAPVGDIKVDLGKWLLSMVPANIFEALAKGDMLPVVTFIAMFALAATRLDDDRRRSLVGLFDAVKDAMLVLVGWIFVIAPLGVFALAVSVGIKAGLGAFGLLGHYIAVLVLVQVGLIILVYPLAIIFGRVGPLAFARAVLPAQAVAVSTQSSIASLPAIFDGAERLGLPETTSRVVLPLAVSIFRITSPCANVAVVLYCGHLYGMDHTALAYLGALLAALVAAVSTGGLPGSITFLAACVPIANAMGVPIAVLPVLLAVELVPDVFRTLGNVTADLGVTAILSRDRTN
ncbi:dicarboxylate/amino acid:cation symporter [Sandarakinorhabdus limnophila]|uniref:dicarboxylate/amino acid:cation symporter n=1 Tax=Sandarakinorhabdus limnophila TaxID=210512 RepID=UPI0026EEAFB5|nr:cation:dicarboxylase symporter family transporter [Sandarakinorhabdus limnophila]MCM0033410.1 dicarboxylate/amino acid:cation symporter [Sandarakinorhabdus limnophila]